MWSTSVPEREAEAGLAVLAQTRSREGGAMKLQFPFLVL